MPDLTYRAKAYLGTPRTPGASTIVYSGHTTRDEAAYLLGCLLGIDGVTGGHLETHVRGIGWVVEDEAGDPDAEPRYPHAAP